MREFEIHRALRFNPHQNPLKTLKINTDLLNHPPNIGRSAGLTHAADEKCASRRDRTNPREN